MAFRLTEFDGQALPSQNAIWDFSTPFLPTVLAPTINGRIDYYGERRRIQHSQMFEVDMRADATTVAGLADQIRDIKKLVWRTGWLHRVEREGGDELRRYCRLLGVGITPRATERGVINKLTLRFETNQPFWYTSSTTTHTSTISSGANISITNSGEEDVLDAVLTITATSNISTLTVEHSKTEGSKTIISKFAYSGVVLSGNAFVVDCGAYTVTNNAVGALAGFTLDATHNEVYWLRIPPGSNTLKITLGTGGGTYALAYKRAYQ